VVEYGLPDGGETWGFEACPLGRANADFDGHRGDGNDLRRGKDASPRQSSERGEQRSYSRSLLSYVDLSRPR